MVASPATPVHLAACGCVTPFGDARATHAALLRGEKALRAVPVRGILGGDPVPLALLPNRALDETAPPSWAGAVRTLLSALPSDGWGAARKPVFVTSSNFGVGNLYAFRQGGGDTAHLAFGAPALCVDWLRRELGWGANVTILSHACVSAHLGLVQAERVVASGVADEALVFSFDLLSPFVAGGFHALKILNAEFPAPYAARAIGAIGLGDGAGFAVLARGRGDFSLLGQSLFNEMHHFTSNQADGSGFAACLSPLVERRQGRKLWLKGHGTGTLEAGRLEATALAAHFPGAPLVGWKGSLGHTLGSCGLVELAIVVESMRAGRAPGTVGTSGTVMAENVAGEPVDVRSLDAAVCTSNAFGGAHAALLIGPALTGAVAVGARDGGGRSPLAGDVGAGNGVEDRSQASSYTEERFITSLAVDDPGDEEPSTTRERLKARFAAGATRRMTQLGMLVGATLGDLAVAADDTVIYASGYGESRALEGYLDSFPEASPTLFQTSIHPSGVQQALIGRQRSLREVFPLAGGAQLPAHALLEAFLAPAARVIVCGGEERGTWLLERGVASDRTFAFALGLERTPKAGAAVVGKITLSQVDAEAGALTLAEFFDRLRERRSFAGLVAPGLRMEVSWA
jgi:hypothetical protein